MSMSDPLLPVPDADSPETDREREDDVEDVPGPDVLRGVGDDETAAPDASTPYRAPKAGEGLDDEQLREDLADE